MVDVATLRIVIDGGNAQGQAGRITADLNRMGDAGDRAQRRMGGLSSTLGAFARVAALAGGAVGGLSFARVVTETASFERQLSSLRAVSQATADEMSRFSTTARELGAATAFSATEAAAGMQALASAGQSTGEILDSIAPALDLATASGLALAEAAELGATTLNQFGLSADQFSRVADTLADAAAAGATTTAQLGIGLRQTGVIAGQAGLSFEATAATLTALADAGLRGEQGGTALRGVLASLAKAASDDAAAAMDRLGITGGTVLEKFEKLKTATLDEVDAFTIFGAEGAAAASVLSQTGDKVEELTARFNDNEGAVKRAADIIGDNLIGDLKELSSALSEAALQVGLDSGLNAGLRQATQSLTEFVSASNDLDKTAAALEEMSFWAESFGSNTEKVIDFTNKFIDFATIQPWIAITEGIRLIGMVVVNLPTIAATALAQVEHFFGTTAIEIERRWDILGTVASAYFDSIVDWAGIAANFFIDIWQKAIARVAGGFSSLLNVLSGVSGFLGFEGAADSIEQTANALDEMARAGASINPVSDAVDGFVVASLKANETLSKGVSTANQWAAVQRTMVDQYRDQAIETAEVAAAQHELRSEYDTSAAALGSMDAGISSTQKSLESLAQKTEAAASATDRLSGAGGGAISSGGGLKGVSEQAREATRSIDELQRAYDSTVAGLERQIALFGDTSDAARLRYEIERGSLQGITPLQEDYLDQLLAQLAQKEQLKEAASVLAAAEKQAAEDTLEAWRFVGDSIDDLFTSVWQGLIDGSKSVGDALKDWFVGLLSQLAQIAVRNAIVVPIVAGVTGNQAFANSFGGPNLGLLSLGGGSPGAASPGGSGFGSSVGQTGFGSIFGGNSISTGINNLTGNLGGLGPANVSNIALAGYGALGYLGGDLIFGGEYGGTGGAVGATAGAIVGSVVPVIGTALGALIGGLLGGAAGSLFGGDYEPFPYSLVQVGGGGLPIGDSPNITRGDVVTGASGLQFQAVSKHQDLAGALALQDELLALDAILAAVAPNAGLAGENLGDFGATLDGLLAGLDGYQDADIDVVEQFVRNWLSAADELDERARDLVLSMQGSGRELTAAFVGLTTLFEFAAASPMQSYQEALEAQEMTLWDAAAAQRNYVVELLATFDGSAASIATLSDAVTARYAMELALIEQIMGMIRGVQDLGQSTIDQFRLATLDDAGRFEFFSMQAEAARGSLDTLTDPAQIWQAFQDGIAAQQSAFNLLSQEQQRMVSEQFIRWTEEFTAEAEALLGDRAAAIEDENAAISAVIEDALQNPANTMAEAAAAMQQAAAEMQAALAAGLPVQVVEVVINNSESQLG